MFSIIKNKDGVILVYSMMMMSVLLSVALGLSYFVIRDLNKARAIDNSIVAYYSAEAGLEQSLYLIKKADFPAEAEKLKTQLTQREMSFSGGVWDLDESVDFESGFLRQRLLNGQNVKFFILRRQKNEDAPKSITVNWLRPKESNANLQVNIIQLDPQNTTDGSLVYYTENSVIETTDSSGELDIRCYDLNDLSLTGNRLSPVDYLVDLKILGFSSDDYIDSLSIKTYNKYCNSAEFEDSYNPSGISNLTIKARGVFGGVSQYINASIAPYDPISGLFGFVLFSEQDITKE